MSSLLHDLRAACLPFVTRTFRGHRLRLYMLLSAVLGALTLVVGLWVAQGSGDLERDARVGLRLEQSYWERVSTEFVVITRGDYDHEEALAERRAMVRHVEHGAPAPMGGWLASYVHDGAAVLHTAINLPAPFEHRALQAEAQALYDRIGHTFVRPDDGTYGFSWNDPLQVEYLTHVVAGQLVPAVERYHSPLGLAGTISVVGMTAGGVLLVLMLFVGPLLVGVGIAQEVHENTLQPLTGTALTPGQLVVGLAAGPVALIGLLGTPQLLVLSLAAFGHGVPEGILAFMAVAVPAAAVLVMLTQIAGHALARRRTPGIVGITLSIALGCAGLFGMTLGMLGDDELLGFLAVIPQMSGFDVLSRVFLPLPTDLEHHLFAANLRLVIGTTCFAVCAGLAAIALRRRIAGRTGPQLQRAEALVGAAVLSAAAVAAVPPELFVHDLSGVYFVSAAIVLLPLQVLLMGRVPVGDGPSRSRIVPLQSLLRDWMLLLTLHFALCALLVGDGWAFERGTPFGIIHVAWTFSVAALIAIRSAAAPLGLWGALWIACCELALTVSFINGAVLILEPDRDGLENIMALSNASPMLGLLQLGSMVVIPVMLADGIRRKTAGIC